MINEPTAAAMAYGLHKVDVFNVLVVDLGGGTLDVSLLNKQGAMFLTRAMAGESRERRIFLFLINLRITLKCSECCFKVDSFSLKLEHQSELLLLSAGNNKLGGQDFSQRLLQFTIERVRQEFGMPPTLKEDIHSLRQAVEAAKINLTLHPSVTIRVPLHLQTQEGSAAAAPAAPAAPAPVLFHTVITRQLFEELNEDLFQKILAPVETVLAEGNLQKEDVDEIVLVGGSTRIPRIRRLISEFFGKEPNTSVDPDLAVVTGVAIQAGIMGGSWPLQVSAIEIPNRHLRKTNFS